MPRSPKVARFLNKLHLAEYGSCTKVEHDFAIDASHSLRRIHFVSRSRARGHARRGPAGRGGCKAGLANCACRCWSAQVWCARRWRCGWPSAGCSTGRDRPHRPSTTRAGPPRPARPSSSSSAPATSSATGGCGELQEATSSPRRLLTDERDLSRSAVNLHQSRSPCAARLLDRRPGDNSIYT